MLPVHLELFEALSAYDLVGFHTPPYLRAFRDYIATEVGGDVLRASRLGLVVRAGAGYNTIDV